MPKTRKVEIVLTPYEFTDPVTGELKKGASPYVRVEMPELGADVDFKIKPRGDLERKALEKIAQDAGFDVVG